MINLKNVRRLFVAFAAVSALVGVADAAAPRSIGELLSTAESWTAEEMTQVANFLHSDEYLILGVVPGGVTVEQGEHLIRIGKGIGQAVLLGEQVKAGALWNSGNESVWVSIGREADLFEIQPGAMVIVGGVISGIEGPNDLVQVNGLPVARTISATCGDGYYACCTGTGGSSYKARCRRNGTSDTDCVGGGEGSTTCTIGD